MRNLEEDREWKIVLADRAFREMKVLPTAVRRDAQDIIRTLSEDPSPPDSLKLRGNRNTRRIGFYYGRHPNRKGHVARYRLIYEVFEATRIIKILRIAYRDELTYKGLDRW